MSVSFIKRQILRFVQAVAYVIFATLGILSLLARRLHAPAALHPDTVRSILVIRLDLLGDVVLSLPAVEALAARYPNATITFLCVPYTRAIPDAHPDIDRVIALDVNRLRSLKAWRSWQSFAEWGDALRQIRATRPDLCVSLFGLLASILAFLSGAPHRIGYHKESYPFLFSRALPGRRYFWPRHEVQYCLDLAAAAGATPADIDGRAPVLTVAPGSARVARQKILAAGMDSSIPYALIHAGAVNGQAKRWSARQWAGLADRLYHDLGLRVVLTGSARDEPLVRQICCAMSTSPIVVVGKTTIPDLVAILADAAIVLSGDSGPLHMAGALGRPTVSIYGPTDPQLSGPYPRMIDGRRVPAEVLRTGVFCSPCYNLLATAECRYRHPVCMSEVTVSAVLAAAKRVLGQPSPARQTNLTQC